MNDKIKKMILCILLGIQCINFGAPTNDPQSQQEQQRELVSRLISESFVNYRSLNRNSELLGAKSKKILYSIKENPHKNLLLENILTMIIQTPILIRIWQISEEFNLTKESLLRRDLAEIKNEVLRSEFVSDMLRKNLDISDIDGNEQLMDKIISIALKNTVGDMKKNPKDLKKQLDVPLFSSLRLGDYKETDMLIIQFKLGYISLQEAIGKLYTLSEEIRQHPTPALIQTKTQELLNLAKHGVNCISSGTEHIQQGLCPRDLFLRFAKEVIKFNVATTLCSGNREIDYEILLDKILAKLGLTLTPEERSDVIQGASNPQNVNSDTEMSAFIMERVEETRHNTSNSPMRQIVVQLEIINVKFGKAASNLL